MQMACLPCPAPCSHANGFTRLSEAAPDCHAANSFGLADTCPSTNQSLSLRWLPPQYREGGLCIPFCGLDVQAARARQCGSARHCQQHAKAPSSWSNTGSNLTCAAVGAHGNRRLGSCHAATCCPHCLGRGGRGCCPGERTVQPGQQRHPWKVPHGYAACSPAPALLPRLRPVQSWPPAASCAPAAQTPRRHWPRRGRSVGRSPPVGWAGNGAGSLVP